MQHIVKSSLLFVALGLGAGTFAHAQQPQTIAPPAATPLHQPNPKHQAKELSKKLGLTAGQTAQIEPILADRDARIQTLAGNTSLDPKSMRQQRRAIVLDTEQKLNAVLTPAQQQQYAALKAERQHGKGTPAPAPSM